MQESDPPGTVSDQNQEEAEGGLSDERSQSSGKDAGKERGARHEDDSPGSSSEGSQATGHPDNAG